MRNPARLFLVSITIIALSVGMAGRLRATQLNPQPLHLQMTLLLLNEILGEQSAGVYTDAKGIEINRYGGTWGSTTNPSYIQFSDPAAGVLPENYTVCSSLLTHMLAHAYQWNWKNYPFLDPLTNKVTSVSSPYPYQYAALIKQGKGFSEQITQLDQVLPGDIMARWEIGSSSRGHVVQVVSIDFNAGETYPAGYPTSNPLLVGSTLYPVSIIDSDPTATHTIDTRLVNVNGKPTTIGGIGQGTIGVLVDANATIIGWTWSLPSAYDQTHPTHWLSFVNSNLYWAHSTTPYETVVGRLATP